jgi:hypothetical protein
MVIGVEALEIAVTDSRTLSLILKLGGSMASLTPIEGGSLTAFGMIGDIGLLVLVVGDKFLDFVRWQATCLVRQARKGSLCGAVARLSVFDLGICVCEKERKIGITGTVYALYISYSRERPAKNPSYLAVQSNR